MDLRQFSANKRYNARDPIVRDSPARKTFEDERLCLGYRIPGLTVANRYLPRGSFLFCRTFKMSRDPSWRDLCGSEHRA